MDGPAPARLTGILRSFGRFAGSFAELPLYHRLAVGCAADPEVAGSLLAAVPGQERPVLLFAAVHEWVLRNPGSDLARWYASVTPRDDLATDDPWPTFRSTVLAERAALEATIATHATQTNEVNRSVLVAVLLAAACADVGEAPVRLVEVGASAGLLLTPDRYRVEVGEVVLGDPASAVRVAGDVLGSVTPDLSSFPAHFVDRVGIDLDPVDVADADAVRWLEACVWPDQPWRIERLRAAVARARRDPPRLVTGDMVDVLGEVAAAGPTSERISDHLVVMGLWTLTYVARARRAAVHAALEGLAQEYRVVSWVHAEPPGCVPGIEPPPWLAADDETERDRPDTVLGMHRWRGGRALDPVTLGWAHPHGNWVRLTS